MFVGRLIGRCEDRRRWEMEMEMMYIVLNFLLEYS